MKDVDVAGKAKEGGAEVVDVDFFSSSSPAPPPLASSSQVLWSASSYDIPHTGQSPFLAALAAGTIALDGRAAAGDAEDDVDEAVEEGKEKEEDEENEEEEEEERKEEEEAAEPKVKGDAEDADDEVKELEEGKENMGAEAVFSFGGITAGGESVSSSTSVQVLWSASS